MRRTQSKYAFACICRAAFSEACDLRMELALALALALASHLILGYILTSWDRE